MSSVTEPVTTDRALDDVLRGSLLTPLFQPIVDLQDRRTVGVEALIRGPAGSELANPLALFERARSAGRVAETDLLCRRRSLEVALGTELGGPAVLFLNAEPEGLGLDPTLGLEDLAATAAARGIRVVLELTERALTAHPAELLLATQRVRDRGWWVALDDVGADHASLALLPFLNPEVIKLDMALVQRRTTEDVAEIVNAVLAHSQRTGALILAEGIETAAHLALAVAMGATLGQGWMFGRPGPLDPPALTGALELPPLSPSVSTGPTPWDVVRRTSTTRTAGKALLVALSLNLERQARAGGGAAVLLGTFQRDRYLTPATRRRYQSLARTAAFVAVFGDDVEPDEIDGVRSIPTAIGSPLAAEWDVIVVGPHFAAALVSHDRGDETDEPQRTFQFTVTYDRDVVLEAARSLLSRIPADHRVAAPTG